MKSKQAEFPKLLFWEEAEKEWRNLDGHQKKVVSKALQRIEENGNIKKCVNVDSKAFTHFLYVSNFDLGTLFTIIVYFN